MKKILTLFIITIWFGSCSSNNYSRKCYYMDATRKISGTSGSICFDSLGYSYRYTEGGYIAGVNSFHYKGKYKRRFFFIILYDENKKVKQLIKIGNKNIYDIGWDHFWTFNSKYKLKRK